MILRSLVLTRFHRVTQGFFKEMLELHKPLPSPPLPFSSPSLPLPLEVGPLIAAKGSGGAL